MKYRLTMLDMCLPDYFRGHSKPVLQVVVWKDMTKQELMECIVSEYNETYEHLTYKGAWPNLNDRQLLTMADKFILAEDPFIDDDLPTLEEMTVEMDDVYLYMICEEDN